MRFKSFVLFILFSWSSLLFAANVRVPKDAIITNVTWTNKAAQETYKTYFMKFLNRSYNELDLKIQIDQISQDLYSQGYLKHKISYTPKLENEKWIVEIFVEYNEMTNFSFHGNDLFTGQQLRKFLLEKIKNNFSSVEIASLEKNLIDLYAERGFYDTKTSVRSQVGVDRNKSLVVNYYFDIEEGHKIKVDNIIFRGNNFYTNEQIQILYEKNASSLAASGFYDRAYLEEFTSILSKEYLKNGYVFIDVSPARIVNSVKNKYTLEFTIAEKHQVMLENINLENVDENLTEEVLKTLDNRAQTPINVVSMEDDLKKIVRFFQNKGYLFTTIKNLNAKDLLTYDKSYSNAVLKPNVELGRKVCFNDAIVNGNSTTKTKVILRELNFKEGQLITPTDLDIFKQRISVLNLFSNIKISPFILEDQKLNDCYKTNLVVQVEEKDFGMLEVAPGFRTDLGAKISTGVTLNNLNGMNRSISFRAQTNKRFNLDGFDDRRRLEKKDLPEYAFRASYGDPYLLHNLFKTQVEFEMSTSYQRNRYYGFDADILRISPQLAKTFTKWFSTSVSYQYEKINQFDATEAKDNDNFSIGGITPTLTFDFRDDVINPRKGAFFMLSSEWANSNFGAIRTDDLEVNFIKLINRNRFYIPMGDFTLAISVAMGYQKNFADEKIYENGQPVLNANGKIKTKGYIPSIKVFRLDGYDEIRGYDENEINRGFDGTPIGELIVQGEAYFTAIKIEQRYNLSDNIRLGVFFDAGRVYVDDFKPFDLRSSVGAGIKFVTPVGSLDFDYGLKLQRKEWGPSTRDSVGRFHLSIGYF